MRRLDAIYDVTTADQKEKGIVLRGKDRRKKGIVWKGKTKFVTLLVDLHNQIHNQFGQIVHFYHIYILFHHHIYDI